MKIIVSFKSMLLTVLVCCLWSVSVFASGLEVSHGYARATPPGVNSAAAYLVLTNETAKNLVLVGVTSEAAKQVMIHQNQLQGDMMRMRHVSQLDLAAGSQLRFEPGGHHLMLTGLIKPLRAGEQLQLILHFQQGAVLAVALPVMAGDAVTGMNNHHE